MPDLDFVTSMGEVFNASEFERERSWEKLRPHGLVLKCVQSSQAVTCGKILSRAKAEVTSMREAIGVRLCCFKIGITSNPPQRYASYIQRGFTRMSVLAISNSIDLISMLEAALISEFQQHVGCKNKWNSGGEGGLDKRSLDPPFYAYVAGGRADQSRWVG